MQFEKVSVATNLAVNYLPGEYELTTKSLVADHLAAYPWIIRRDTAHCNAIALQLAVQMRHPSICKATIFATQMRNKNKPKGLQHLHPMQQSGIWHPNRDCVAKPGHRGVILANHAGK